jgi:hypothetical protein
VRAEYCTYTVDLHNDVNRALGKPELSYAEARAHMRARLYQQGHSGHTITRSFPALYWSLLVVACHTAPLQDLHQLIHAFCFVVPFARYAADGQPGARACMLGVPLDLGTRDTALDSVRRLHNSVCGLFGEPPLTVRAMVRMAVVTGMRAVHNDPVARLTHVACEDVLRRAAARRRATALYLATGLSSATCVALLVAICVTLGRWARRRGRHARARAAA